MRRSSRLNEESPILYKECLICTCLNQEIKNLKLQLFRDLQSEMNNLNARSLPIREKRSEQGFNQIMQIVFRDVVQVGARCNHKIFHKFLVQELKCTQEVFNFVCERLAKKLIQNKKHLDKSQKDVQKQVNKIPKPISQKTMLTRSKEQVLVEPIKSQRQILKSKNPVPLQPVKSEKQMMTKSKDIVSQLPIRSERQMIQSNHPVSQLPIRSERSITQSQSEGRITMSLTRNEEQKNQGQILSKSKEQQEQQEQDENDPCVFFGFLSRKKKF